MTVQPTPPPPDAGANLEQKFFADAIKEVETNRQKFFWEGVARRALAYLLKTVSIFGAIVVAAKIEIIPQTALGIIIAAAIGLDQLTSNHARLLAVVAARHASDRLLAAVRKEHSVSLPAIIDLRIANPAQATARLQSLLAKLNLQMHEGKEVILEGLREADLKALNNLYVDVKKN